MSNSELTEYTAVVMVPREITVKARGPKGAALAAMGIANQFTGQPVGHSPRMLLVREKKNG